MSTNFFFQYVRTTIHIHAQIMNKRPEGSSIMACVRVYVCFFNFALYPEGLTCIFIYTATARGIEEVVSGQISLFVVFTPSYTFGLFIILPHPSPHYPPSPPPPVQQAHHPSFSERI